MNQHTAAPLAKYWFTNNPLFGGIPGLRLWPVVPNNARAAIRDTVLPLGGGPDGKSPVFVKKGTTLAYSVYAMHRRQDIYGPDAAEFRPERWETIRPGWEYLPFNGGPRICLGRKSPRISFPLRHHPAGPGYSF